MLENVEITLRQCVTTVPVSELIVVFLFGWKQRIKTVCTSPTKDILYSLQYTI